MPRMGTWAPFLSVFQKAEAISSKRKQGWAGRVLHFTSMSHSEVRGGFCYHSILTGAYYVSCSLTDTGDHRAVGRMLLAMTEEANLETKQNKKLTKAIPASPQHCDI